MTHATPGRHNQPDSAAERGRRHVSHDLPRYRFTGHNQQRRLGNQLGLDPQFTPRSLRGNVSCIFVRERNFWNIHPQKLAENLPSVSAANVHFKKIPRPLLEVCSYCSSMIFQQSPKSCSRSVAGWHVGRQPVSKLRLATRHPRLHVPRRQDEPASRIPSVQFSEEERNRVIGKRLMFFP